MGGEGFVCFCSGASSVLNTLGGGGCGVRWDFGGGGVGIPGFIDLAKVV